jgi:hypothetical protein
MEAEEEEEDAELGEEYLGLQAWGVKHYEVVSGVSDI